MGTEVESGEGRHMQTSEEASAMVQMSNNVAQGWAEAVGVERSGQILDLFWKHSRLDSRDLNEGGSR